MIIYLIGDILFYSLAIQVFISHFREYSVNQNVLYEETAEINKCEFRLISNLNKNT